MRVAVIGGGPSGMLAVKSLKEEDIEPVCFEKTAYFGGTWRYHGDDVEGIGSLMWTTSINHSKELGAISDCPSKKEYPNYMRHHEVLEMFQDFAKKFDLFRYIYYNTEVVFVTKSEDYESTGKWKVKTENHENGNISEEIFDGVMVCTGHITHPKMPTFPGMEKYGGKIMHTHSLKKVQEFEGQKVVVVGIGCSGLDAAVEISNVAKQVYLSARTGAWIFSRVGPCGLPTDFAILRRVFWLIHEYAPVVSNILLESYLNNRFDHSLYNIKPKCQPTSKDPSVSDILPCKLLTGSVVVRKNIKCFTENGVLFEGEEQITKADSVIMATGYTWKYPFLDEGILSVENGRIGLYKCMYPTQFPYPTLAIINFALPFGPGFPVGELQCRWASHLLAGKSCLPSTDIMKAEAIRRHEQNIKRFSPSEKVSVRVHSIPYLDDIASEFGVKPNFLKMAFKDPKLFTACILGPFLPYQFRLEGPHSWTGAREAVLTAHDRMSWPLLSTDRSTESLFTAAGILSYEIPFFFFFLVQALIAVSTKFCTLVMLFVYLLFSKNFFPKFLLFMIVLLCFAFTDFNPVRFFSALYNSLVSFNSEYSKYYVVT